VLSARFEASALVITIRDDGRGIDRVGLAAAAAPHGRALHTDQDVTDPLFLDGLSTKTEALKNRRAQRPPRIVTTPQRPGRRCAQRATASA